MQIKTGDKFKFMTFKKNCKRANGNGIKYKMCTKWDTHARNKAKETEGRGARIATVHGPPQRGHMRAGGPSDAYAARPMYGDI